MPFPLHLVFYAWLLIIPGQGYNGDQATYVPFLNKIACETARDHLANLSTRSRNTQAFRTPGSDAEEN